MIIKFKRIISCSSEHADYPASNLLTYHSNSSWRTAEPGKMLATVILELEESCCIIGVDIGNYRSCVVNVSASTKDEPDNWIPIVNHQFLTNDEAADGKFKDQVQIFTKRELDPETLKIKFDRVKVTCMQSANTKTLFGLSFITLRTEVVVDMGLDKFGRFKLKEKDKDDSQLSFDLLKEKYLKGSDGKNTNYKTDLFKKIKEMGLNNFEKRQQEEREPKKRPLLEKLEAGKADEVFSKPVKRTPFGDIIPSPQEKKTIPKIDKVSSEEKKNSTTNNITVLKDRESTSNIQSQSSSSQMSNGDQPSRKKLKCCESDDVPCKVCKKLPKPKASPKNTVKKKKQKGKPFSKLFEDVSFSLSGYVNPQRDAIRQKALQMGAKYIANPDATNRCTHLICAFKNTPKANQMKGLCKIVNHSFIEECFQHKKRFPWRRYAWNESEKKAPESEDEVESIDPTQSIFDRDTDSDTN